MKLDAGKAVGIFLAVAGLVGTAVQLLTAPDSLRAISFLFLFAILLLAGIWIVVHNIRRRHKTGRALPPIEQIEDICAGYHVAPAKSEEMDWIARLEAEVYSAEDAVPKHVLKEWYNSNPTGFNIIRMTNGQKIGHIDILPLRPASLRTFLEGNIVEKDIRGDSLYSEAERHLIRDLYVESIIVLPPKGYSNAPAILCVLTNFAGLMERICDTSNVENVYAIAASKSGELLLTRLGFDAITPAENRADHHDFFAASFAELAKNISMLCGTRFPEETFNRILRNRADNNLSTKL